MTNVDPDNGVAYGYLRADALAPEIAAGLMENQLATDYTYEAALAEHLAIERRAEYEAGRFNFDEDYHRELFNQEWESYEPIVEGELHGVEYRSSWADSVLHFVILKSPYTSNSGGVITYDVPADWRAKP